MANERKMTLRYQVKIDKMTSIDINIILVLFTENEKGKKCERKKRPLPFGRKKTKSHNQVNSIVRDKMVHRHYLFAFFVVCLTSGHSTYSVSFHLSNSSNDFSLN